MTYNSTNSIIAGLDMRSVFLLGILMVSLFLYGCGRKGPLRLPEHQVHAGAAVSVPVSPDTGAQPTGSEVSASQISNDPSTQPAGQP